MFIKKRTNSGRRTEANPSQPGTELTPSVSHNMATMQRHVAQEATKAFSGSVRRPANYAELLSQIWEMSEQLIEDVRLSDAPLEKKVGMLRDLTKLLPALDKAESRHRVHIGKRVVADMSQRDLEIAVKEIMKRKGQST